MEDIIILETIERYLCGEMTSGEKIYFEDMCKKNPGIDQMVVEHKFFLRELDKFGKLVSYKQSLNEVQGKLTDEGVISRSSLSRRARVAYMWKKYKRIAAVAASIAGIVSILTVVLASIYNDNKSNKEIILLSNDIKTLKEGQKATAKELNEVKNEVKIKIDPKATFISGGTGFLIDGNGYLITNAHVLKGRTIIATNDKGQQFLAKLCTKDPDRDIAVLKIEDKDFKPLSSLPYRINKTVNLAEPIYTMGYPKDEIVYSEGYLSSETGNKSDTLTYQIAIAADHGNSGGPVLNKNGDIIGILTDKLEGGAVFALKSLYIFKTVEKLKKDIAYSNIRLASTNSIKGLIREQQVKKVNNCVFLIKSYD